ncbi:hypothetical protein HK101_009343 [Irineochytrium annulatum]|nr:hypothetical protein HK101_009343 [Irineochytrium annulatum]
MSKFDVWTQYTAVPRALRVPFRRRVFNTLGLDENNVIRPLTSFVRPVTMHDTRLFTPQDAAMAVSRIPYIIPIVPRSTATKRLMALHMSAAEEKVVDNSLMTDSTAIAGWMLCQNPHSVATENFYGQISSPQTMLLSRRGSLIEHSLLLCGLLLGMGFKAYVAIGKVKRRPYVWVVTINPITVREDTGNFDEFAPCKISYYYSDENPSVEFQRSEFANLRDAIKAQEANKRFKVVHWDALTELIDYIQLYRRHVLFISETEFHRDGSKHLQSQLNRFESTLTGILTERAIANLGDNQFSPFDANGSGVASNAPPFRRRAGSRGSLLSLTLFRDNSLNNMEPSLSRLVDETMVDLLPDGHWWRGDVFHFKDMDVEAITDQIGSVTIHASK